MYPLICMNSRCAAIVFQPIRILDELADQTLQGVHTIRKHSLVLPSLYVSTSIIYIHTSRNHANFTDILSFKS